MLSKRTDAFQHWFNQIDPNNNRINYRSAFERVTTLISESNTPFSYSYVKCCLNIFDVQKEKMIVTYLNRSLEELKHHYEQLGLNYSFNEKKNGQETYITEQFKSVLGIEDKEPSVGYALDKINKGCQLLSQIDEIISDTEKTIILYFMMSAYKEMNGLLRPRKRYFKKRLTFDNLPTDNSNINVNNYRGEATSTLRKRVLPRLARRKRCFKKRLTFDNLPVTDKSNVNVNDFRGE